MSKLIELEELIVKWAEARRLIPLANPETQLMKNISEIGELADAIVKNDLPEIKDAIGDIFVILVIWNRLKWNHDTDWYEEIAAPIVDVNASFSAFIDDFNGLFQGSIYGNKSDRFYFFILLDYLASFARHYGFTLEECVESAYNEIKDRKGTLLPNGVFVKEV